MLRLLLKSELSVQRLIIYLCAAITCAHLVALAMLFFWYHTGAVYHFQISRQLLNQNVPVVFMPLRKSAATASLSKQGAPIKPIHQSAGKDIKSLAQKPKTSIATSKKEVQKTEPKKIQDKKAPILKKDVKADPKKDLKQSKKEEPKKVEPVKSPQTKTESAQKNEDNSLQTSINVEPIVVGQQEWDALHMQQSLQEEVARCWQPPIGLSPDLACEIIITCSWQGEIQSSNIKKSSGVPIFDMSVRQAVAEFKPPRWAYGKDIAITFTG